MRPQNQSPPSLFRKNIYLRKPAPLELRGRNGHYPVILNFLKVLYSQKPPGEDSSQAWAAIQKSLPTGKTLRRAFKNLSRAQQGELREKVGKKNLEALFYLSETPTEKNFWRAALDFGRNLKFENQLKPAERILGFLAQNNLKVPAKICQQARLEWDAILGRGNWSYRLEFLASRFLKEATDYRMILPMIAGSVIYNLAKTATLGRLVHFPARWWSRGLGGRALAATVGYSAEVPSFALMNRGLRQMSGQSVGNWTPDLLQAGITLGVLKLGSFLGTQTFLKAHGINEIGMATRLKGFSKISRALYPQATMFTGLLVAHGIETHIGLRDDLKGATWVTDALSTLLSLSIGAKLGHRLLGKSFHKYQKNLGKRAHLYTQYLGRPRPIKKHSSSSIFTGIKNLIPSIPTTTLSPIGIRIPLMAEARDMNHFMTGGDENGSGFRAAKGLEPHKTIKTIEAKDIDLDDLDALRVLADTLIEKGDPRGELIAVELKMEDTKNPKDLKILSSKQKKLRSSLTKGYPSGFNLEWKRGFITKINYGPLRTVEKFYLKRALNQEPHLKAINFKNNPFGLLESFFEIPQVKKITSFTLFSHRESDINTILANAHKIPELSHLDINLRDIPDISSIITDIANKFPNLEHLTLRNGLQGAQTLVDNAKKIKKLSVLDLRGHVSGDYAIEVLARNGKAFPNLIQLNLARNQISEEGLRSFVNNAENFPRLTHLDISNLAHGEEYFNGGHGYLVARMFSENLDKFKNLAHLDISKNVIGEDGSFAIARNASKFSKLNSLNLAGCIMGDNGFRRIVESGEYFFNLKELILDGNRLTGESLKIFFRNANYFHRLRRLSLMNNEVRGDTIPELVNAASTFNNLTHLNLKRTGLSEKNANEIKNSYKSLKIVEWDPWDPD